MQNTQDTSFNAGTDNTKSGVVSVTLASVLLGPRVRSDNWTRRCLLTQERKWERVLGEGRRGGGGGGGGGCGGGAREVVVVVVAAGGLEAGRLLGREGREGVEASGHLQDERKLAKELGQNQCETCLMSERL
ncbi:hypothetical protein E2C01_089615 [Portunus trituberculatus]|uniref:Uncharacterized protein n=1 Tax=Portunus trituberculatus TaxID=210409 RepID=A0A5B7JQ23_PORTR|nr:hypothetical protein [Portunus trituberculatus]